MITCQNCGRENAAGGHFCRFCGSGLTVRSHEADPDRDERRPYLWKTDEYQTQTESRPATAVADVHAYSAAPLAYQPPRFMSGSYRCPYCASEFLPRLERRISTTGWIVFALLLVFIFPLFWIGLLIKEDVHVCPACRSKLN